MLNFTEAQKESWLLGLQKNLKLTFSDGTVLTNENIVSESMYFEQNLCDSSDLNFGSVCSATFSIEIYNDLKSYKGKTVSVELETEDNTVKIGTFIVYSDENTEGMLSKKLKCYDKVYGLSDIDVSNWYESINFNVSGGVTLKNFRDSLFNHIGIEQVDCELINDDIVLSKSIESSDISALEVIRNICQANACFGIINNNGKFSYVYVPRATTDNIIYPSDTLFLGEDVFPINTDIYTSEFLPSDYRQRSFTYSYSSCKKVTRLHIRTEYGDVGHTFGTDTSNTYTISGNFILYGIDEEQIETAGQRLLGQISSLPEYNPSTVTTRFRPWVELGDFIKVSGNSGSAVFPVLKRSFSGITAIYDTYHAFGEEYYSEETSSIESSIERITGRTNILSRELEKTRSVIDDMESGLRSSIEQTREDIISTVLSTTRSELEGYKQQVSTQFSQTSDAFNMKFNNIKESLGSEIESNGQSIEEIQSYIRFVDGKIILGRDDSELELSISNNVMKFSQNGEEVAYFANNKMYVNNGEFENAIRIGNFGFVPLADGGLHFKKMASLSEINALNLLEEGDINGN